jgi:hypothetical protein
MGSVLVTSDLLSLTISFGCSDPAAPVCYGGFFAYLSILPSPEYANSACICGLIPVFLLFVILFSLIGLYPGNRLSPVEEAGGCR